MSWEEEVFALLDDLEQQAEAMYAAERDADLADRSRAAYREVTLASRLMASVGEVLRLDITGVGGAAERSVPEVAWSPVARLGLGSALRRIADAGERCVAHVVDGTTYYAQLRRIGSDFVEARVGEDRTVLVAFSALAAVQSRE